MEQDLSHTRAIQYIAREFIIAAYEDVNADAKIDEILMQEEVDAEALFHQISLEDIEELCVEMLKSMVQSNSAYSTYTDVASESTPTQHGSGKTIIYGVLLLGMIISLRVGTVKVSDNEFEITFQSENTEPIINMLTDILPKFDDLPDTKILIEKKD